MPVWGIVRLGIFIAVVVWAFVIMAGFLKRERASGDMGRGNYIATWAFAIVFFPLVPFVVLPVWGGFRFLNWTRSQATDPTTVPEPSRMRVRAAETDFADLNGLDLSARWSRWGRVSLLAIPLILGVSAADVPYATGPLIVCFVFLLYGGIGMLAIGIVGAGRGRSWVSFAKRNGFGNVGPATTSNGEKTAVGVKGILGREVEFVLQDVGPSRISLHLHLDWSLPHVVIDSRPEPELVGTSALPAHYDPGHRLPIGDGWDRYVRVYSTDTERPLVAPHATELARTAASLQGVWDIEIKGSEVTFVGRRSWITGAAVAKVFAAAEALVRRLPALQTPVDPDQEIPKTGSILERLVHGLPYIAVGSVFVTGLLLRVVGEVMLPYFIASVFVVSVGGLWATIGRALRRRSIRRKLAEATSG